MVERGVYLLEDPSEVVDMAIETAGFEKLA